MLYLKLIIKIYNIYIILYSIYFFIHVEIKLKLYNKNHNIVIHMSVVFPNDTFNVTIFHQRAAKAYE